MKTFIFSFLALIYSITVNAQNDNFKKGQTDLQFGIGFLSTLNNTFKNVGFETKLTVPPVSATIDHAITDELSIGGTIAYAQTHLNDQGQDIGTVSHLIIVARGLYHFDLTPSLDTYGGAMLGYNIAKFSDENYKNKASAFAYTFLVGGRYRLAKTVGLFLELGYGVASVNLGLNIKL